MLKCMVLLGRGGTFKRWSLWEEVRPLGAWHTWWAWVLRGAGTVCTPHWRPWELCSLHTIHNPSCCVPPSSPHPILPHPASSTQLREGSWRGHQEDWAQRGRLQPLRPSLLLLLSSASECRRLSVPRWRRGESTTSSVTKGLLGWFLGQEAGGENK
jgi:hypothetical protein